MVEYYRLKVMGYIRSLHIVPEYYKLGIMNLRLIIIDCA